MSKQTLLENLQKNDGLFSRLEKKDKQLSQFHDLQSPFRQGFLLAEEIVKKWAEENYPLITKMDEAASQSSPQNTEGEGEMMEAMQNKKESPKPEQSQEEPQKEFCFHYSSTGKDLMVKLKAGSLNEAMIKFANTYHEVDEIYGITPPPSPSLFVFEPGIEGV